MGAAGNVLTRLLGTIGLRREEIYITNVVKCRPPGNRDPEPAEVETCSPFLDAQIEIIQPDVILVLGRHALARLLPGAGGITHLRRIASFADLYGVRTGCHGATDLSPICLGAALHFDLSVPNFGIQEHMPHAALTDEVFPHAYTYANGTMHPGEAPGHGVEIDEAAAQKFPYKRAYLPVCRLEDGTMHNW